MGWIKHLSIVLFQSQEQQEQQAGWLAVSLFQ